MGDIKEFKPQITFINPKELVPYEYNSKTHPPEQVTKIANQIKRFGMDQPIVILPNKQIVKGVGRWLAAQQLELTVVPVIVNQMEEADAVASRIGDNKVAESEWDWEKLSTDFEFLKTQNYDFLFTGFGQDEIDKVMNGWVHNFDEVESIDENLDGIYDMIKIICPPGTKKEVIEHVKMALTSCPIPDVKLS